MPRLLPLLLALGLASGAFAASAVEATRASASAARARVNEVRGHQMALRQELNQLAAQIEALKAREAGALIAGGELDRSLKRSQELSGLLSDAAVQLSQAEGQAQQQNLTLLTALSEGLAQLKADWERTTDREQRRQILIKMKALRLEREQVRAQLPAQAIPALEATRSDDPSELLEQADALRDAEDKVRARIRSLQARIAEARDEKELDRRMGEFLGEQALFDEHDRRLRTSREADPAAGTLNAAGPPRTTGPGLGGPPGPAGTGGGSGGSSGSNTDSASLPTLHAQDGRPEVGVVAAPEPDDLQGMEKKLQELDATARGLKQRAQEVEARARQLQ